MSDSDPEVRLSRAHHPVTALGWGVRTGIWLQGCTIGCPGCLSRDTWPADPSMSIALSSIADWLASTMPASEGLTISGGEPFEQPAAVAHLAASARAAAGDREVDVLVYSGRSWVDLEREHAGVLEGVDAVISEPFVAGRPADDGWRGSTNQEFHPLSSLGRARSPETWSPERRLQVVVDDESLWMVGIPRHGDLSAMERTLRESGVELRNSSWRP